MIERGGIPKLLKCFSEIPEKLCTKIRAEKHLAVLKLLILGTKFPGNSDPPPTQLENANSILNLEDQDEIISFKFMARAIGLSLNVKAMPQILTHVIWENEPLTLTFLKNFRQVLFQVETERVGSVVNFLRQIFGIPDSLQGKRIRNFLPELVDDLTNRMESRDRPQQCKEIIRHIRSIEMANADVKKCLKKVDAKWSALLQNVKVVSNRYY